jgi:homoserine kinase
MSSSSSKTTNIIVATALAAATAGAAITYTAMKSTRKEDEVGALRKGRTSKNALIYDSVVVDKSADTREILFPHNHEEKMKRRIAARVSVEEENMTPRQSVTVRVPATSANVGPGCE